MYKQDLYSIVTPIKRNVLSKRNSLKNWKYGYDKETDVIVISKTGQIGEIYNIQGLKIALPKAPKKIIKGDNLWKPEEYPKELKRIQSIFEWKDYLDSFKQRWEPYIDEQLHHRACTQWLDTFHLPLPTPVRSLNRRSP